MEDLSNIKVDQVVEVEVFAHFPFGLVVKIKGVNTLGLIHHASGMPKDLPYKEWPDIGEKLQATIIGLRSDPVPQIYLQLNSYPTDKDLMKE